LISRHWTPCHYYNWVADYMVLQTTRSWFLLKQIHREWEFLPWGAGLFL